ncbi:MAG TPA: hypothetical protein VGQ20_06915 [Acidimicrobiales bacterium]|nr:hypothetical protein [Acidimicrobiales bacterium]
MTDRTVYIAQKLRVALAADSTRDVFVGYNHSGWVVYANEHGYWRHTPVVHLPMLEITVAQYHDLLQAAQSLAGSC